MILSLKVLLFNLIDLPLYSKQFLQNNFEKNVLSIWKKWKNHLGIYQCNESILTTEMHKMQHCMCAPQVNLDCNDLGHLSDQMAWHGIQSGQTCHGIKKCTCIFVCQNTSFWKNIVHPIKHYISPPQYTVFFFLN